MPSKLRWGTVGFFVVWCFFAAMGVFGLYQDAQYAATLPPGPRCGNGVLAAMLMIFPVGPVFGTFGFAVGACAAWLVATPGGLSSHVLRSENKIRNDSVATGGTSATGRDK